MLRASRLFYLDAFFSKLITSGVVVPVFKDNENNVFGGNKYWLTVNIKASTYVIDG
jgi:hypothetical protein